MTTTTILNLDISPHFIRSAREEETTTHSGKPTLTTFVTIKGEHLRDNCYDGKDEEFDADEVAEHEGQLFSYDPNHSASHHLSNELVQQHMNELKELIDVGTLERVEDAWMVEFMSEEEIEAKQKEYVGQEWFLWMSQLKLITKGKEEDYTISDEGLLKFNEVPQVIWEHLEGGWCDG